LCSGIRKKKFYLINLDGGFQGVSGINYIALQVNAAYGSKNHILKRRQAFIKKFLFISDVFVSH
jgi:hypothetical protein